MGSAVAPGDRRLLDVQRQGFPARSQCGADYSRGDCVVDWGYARQVSVFVIFGFVFVHREGREGREGLPKQSLCFGSPSRPSRPSRFNNHQLWMTSMRVSPRIALVLFSFAAVQNTL